MSALLIHPLTGAAASRCTNPVEHRPRPLRFVWHHVQPESAGGTASTLVEVCDGCHYGTHALVYYMRTHGGALPRGGSGYERDIAAAGYAMCVAAGTVDLIPNEGGSVSP